MESLNALSTVLELGFALLGMCLAAVAGTLLAVKLSPYSPSASLAELDARETLYESTQRHLRHLQAQRRFRRALIEALDAKRNETTKVQCIGDSTVPDLSIADRFAVAPCRTVEVGQVRALTNVAVW